MLTLTMLRKERLHDISPAAACSNMVSPPSTTFSDCVKIIKKSQFAVEKSESAGARTYSSHSHSNLKLSGALLAAAEPNLSRKNQRWYRGAWRRRRHWEEEDHTEAARTATGIDEVRREISCSGC